MSLVVIQLGHCYRRTGATGTNGVDGDPNEQEFATSAGNRAAVLLRVAGHQARVILADDDLDDYEGDAFCAIHCDGSTSPSARGCSVGYRNDSGKKLAQAWKHAYFDLGWRGFRPDNYTDALAGYYGTRHAVNQGNRHAFIAEAGFLTSPDDERLLSGAAGTERFARALTNAVVSVFGGRTATPPSEEEDMTPDQARKLDEVHKAVQDVGAVKFLVGLLWDLNAPNGFRYVDPNTGQLVAKGTPGAKPVTDVWRWARESALQARQEPGEHASIEELIEQLRDLHVPDDPDPA